jgi:hypothetical protein
MRLLVGSFIHLAKRTRAFLRQAKILLYFFDPGPQRQGNEAGLTMKSPWMGTNSDLLLQSTTSIY